MSEQATVLTQKHIARLIPKRPRDSHKGLFGTVVVIGGKRGMVGAPLMAARAALKLGAGCVHVGLLADNAPGVDLLQPELMLHPASDALRLPGANVLAIGCGMGTDLVAHKILYDALHSTAALVLDADALNILAARPDFRSQLSARKAATVLTPHPGEAARLLACEIADVQANRNPAAEELRKRFHSSVVLKGADSVCATRDGKLFVNKTGNPGMSAAGMGDVLTGMIAAWLAQLLDAEAACKLAVYLHGMAGDLAEADEGEVAMTSADVAGHIGDAILELTARKRVERASTS